MSDELAERREQKRVEHEVELHRSRWVKPFERPDGCVCGYPTRGYHDDYCDSPRG